MNNLGRAANAASACSHVTGNAAAAMTSGRATKVRWTAPRNWIGSPSHASTGRGWTLISKVYMAALRNFDLLFQPSQVTRASGHDRHGDDLRLLVSVQLADRLFHLVVRFPGCLDRTQPLFSRLDLALPAITTGDRAAGSAQAANRRSTSAAAIRSASAFVAVVVVTWIASRMLPSPLHNFFIQRPDGTTAAHRFFGTPSRNLFEWLLNRLPLPARPRHCPA